MSGAIRIINQGVGAVNLVQNVAGIASTAFGFQLPDINIPGFGPILIKRPRKIDTIIPNVAIEENHRDRLHVTDHPVELGAAITDHAFKEPVELMMQIGWSNSSGFYETYSQDMYKRVLALQNERRPFSVTTGKRQYTNMLITDIAVTTTVQTEFSLMMTVTMREVILVRLATVRQSKESQNEPDKTTAPSKDGDKKPEQTDQPPTPNDGGPTGTADFRNPPDTPGPAHDNPVGTPPGSGTAPPLTPHVTVEALPPPGGEFGPTGDPGGSSLSQPPFDPTAPVTAPAPPQPMAAPPAPPVPATPPAVTVGPSPPVPAIVGPSFDPGGFGSASPISRLVSRG